MMITFVGTAPGIRSLTIISWPLPVGSALGKGLTMYPLTNATYERNTTTNRARILASNGAAYNILFLYRGQGSQVKKEKRLVHVLQKDNELESAGRFI